MIRAARWRNAYGDPLPDTGCGGVLEHAGPLPVPEPSFRERNLREALAWT